MSIAWLLEEFVEKDRRNPDTVDLKGALPGPSSTGNSGTAPETPSRKQRRPASGQELLRVDISPMLAGRQTDGTQTYLDYHSMVSVVTRYIKVLSQGQSQGSSLLCLFALPTGILVCSTSWKTDSCEPHRKTMSKCRGRGSCWRVCSKVLIGEGYLFELAGLYRLWFVFHRSRTMDLSLMRTSAEWPRVLQRD